jgi:4-amino-4-deoxy-L-arabinose transferase-like glycosyltransferase
MDLEKKNIFNKDRKIYLLSIIAIAFFLRIFNLGNNPNGFFCDEASNGYDSYSILYTLKDQHGQFLPLFARALDDYRPSLYIFLTVPFIKIFGLNEFATRSPAALAGVLTVLVIYYLAKEIFNEKIGLFTAGLLAISPWHIQFSRIAFEAILIPLLLSLGILFFVKSFKNANYLIVSAFSFALSLHTYQAARVFVSLSVLGLAILYRQHLWKHKKQTAIATVVFLVIFIPLFSFWISPEGMARAKSARVETDLVTVFQSYLSYFNPVFLFFKGDPILRHSPSKLGELYYFEIISVAVGLFYICREKFQGKGILFLWLALYPIPAALTSPEHALRAIAGVPLFAMFSAFGIVKLIDLCQERKQRLLTLVGSVILIASLAILTERYFISYPKYSFKDWEYGMREAITYAENHSYNRVVMSNKIYHRKCGSIHVFIPFYTQSNPAEYQRSPISPQTRKKLFLGETDYAIGKYNLVSMDKQQEFDRNSLLIIPPQETKFLKNKGYNWKEVHKINSPLGDEVLKLIQVN